MSMTILKDNNIKARKEHRCMALDCIKECDIEDVISYITPEENKELSKLLVNNGNIQSGEVYRSYSMAGNGTIQTMKESLIGAELCSKYKLYPEQN